MRSPVAVTSVSGLDWRRRAEARTAVRVAAGLAGIAATALTVWAVARSPILVDPMSLSIWRGLVVALYVAVGLYTWWRRPDSRLGPLLVGNGFLYAATSFDASGSSWAYTLGMVMWAVYVVYTAYVLLSYPRGRLESSLERAFICAYALSTAVLTGLILALSPTFPGAGAFNDCGTHCPANALVAGDAATGTALNTASSSVFTIGLIGLAMLLFNKARTSGSVVRRAVTPVAAVFAATVAWFAISLYVVPAYPGALSAARIVDGVLGVAIPIAILLGLVWGDLFAAISLSQIAVRAREGPLTPAGVQKMLGDALDDSSLAMALWDSDRSSYVDVYGAPLALSGTSERGITTITENGSPVAALIHDPALETDSEMIEGMAATSMMLLDNTRLVEELRESRARIVETVDRERRRLEQDLHDGAQQRLVAVQVRIRLLQEQTADEDLARQLEAIGVDAEEAIDDLRTLAHGIYPPLLRDRGLADALRSLAMRSPVPIEVTDEGIGRCSAPVEAATYFCSVEAVQNAIKHAGSGAHVTVVVGRARGKVYFSVADDGVGMADARAGNGMGLVGMRDRIGAVGGELEVVSSPGVGTTVRGTVPIGGPALARAQSVEGSG
jgi:signal transduction histidine kinase